MEQANDSPAASAASPAPRRNRWRLALIALAVLAVGTGFLLWYVQGRRPAIPEVPAIDLTGADPEVADAITAARDDLRKTPRSADAWGHLAMTLHAHSYRGEAMVCYGAAADLDANNVYWPYLQGAILEKGPEPASALPFLDRAAQLSALNSVPRLAQAQLLLELARFDEAAEHFRIVLEADPQNIQAQLGLGQLALRRKQYKESLAYLNATAESPYARKRSCVMRAMVYDQLGDVNAAERERTCASPLPDDPPWPDPAMELLSQMQVGLRARLQRAASYGQSGRAGDAVVLLHETVQHYPTSDQALASLGKALIATNDLAGAGRALEECVKRGPKNSDHWFHLGLSRQLQRRYKDAVEAFREAVKLRPTDAQAHFNLGECFESLEDRGAAADAFRAALRCRPDMEAARTRLAKLDSK